MNCKDIKAQAEIKNIKDLNIVFKDGDQEDYNKKRIIANSRFNLKPCAIAYCKNENHVAFCIKFCAEHKIPFRIRSGGHQHEGMCSSDDVLLIDLSLINEKIRYVERDTAWISTGKKNGDVYKELKKTNQTFSGGGCPAVCVGGLVQGGGWSPIGSMYGLTCDNIIAAKIVLANGKIVTATEDNEYSDLFWAIRGGGGGNFGVAIKFLFQLLPLNEGFQFTLKWGKKKMEQLLEAWMTIVLVAPKELNINCRVTVVDEPTIEKPAVSIIGIFYGNRSDLDQHLKPLLDIQTPLEKPCIKPLTDNNNCNDKDELRSENGDLKYTNSQLEIGRQLQQSNAPAETCDAPHPHKISSAFPSLYKKLYIGFLARDIAGHIKRSRESSKVNKYLSLMCMSGVIKNATSTKTAFPYRQAGFVMQFQAWWSDINDPQASEYINWIKVFKEAVKDRTFGCFINFPDRQLLSRNKRELLSHYYGDNLDRLILVKSRYDPNDLFNFELSIPVDLSALNLHNKVHNAISGIQKYKFKEAINILVELYREGKTDLVKTILKFAEQNKKVFQFCYFLNNTSTDSKKIFQKYYASPIIEIITGKRLFIYNEKFEGNQKMPLKLDRGSNRAYGGNPKKGTESDDSGDLKKRFYWIFTAVDDGKFFTITNELKNHKLYLNSASGDKVKAKSTTVIDDSFKWALTPDKSGNYYISNKKYIGHSYLYLKGNTDGDNDRAVAHGDLSVNKVPISAYRFTITPDNLY